MRFRKRSWLFSMASLFAATVLFCGVFSVSAKAGFVNDEWAFSEVQIASEYKIGDELVIPTMSVTNGDKNYACTSVVILPDGSVVEKSSIVFEKSGNYSILYKAVVDGKYVEQSVDFTVINDLYSVYDKKSNVSYGTNPYLNESIKGINVSLKPDDIFTFNQVIDVSKLTRSDKILKFYVTPAEKGAPEASDMYVKLTDIYDSNNFVLVRYNMNISEMSWAWNYIYASAGANGQDLVGYEWGFDSNGNNIYNMHKNSWAGLRSWVSFTGENPKAPGEVAGNAELMERLATFEENYDYLSMDYVNATLHAKTQNYWRDHSMIVDLDDPETFGANVWGGFTTGEVRMSIYFENYAGASANIFITDVANMDLTDFNFKDDVAPVIEIDYDGYTQDTVPMAFVNQPYKLFEGRAIDNLDENVKLETKVYYNYYSSARTQSYVNNGSFIPKRAGKYTIVYSAKDTMGNVSNTFIDLSCINSTEKVAVEVEGNGKTFAIGEQVRLNGYSVARNNGRYSVKIEAVLQSDNSVRYEIDSDTLLFKPMHTGVYDVNYTVTDYTHTVTATDVVTVNKSDTPILATYSEFPAYLIKGCQYTFEQATAYDYSGATMVEMVADYYVVEDNGTAVKMENNTFTVSASSSVEIFCRANNGKAEMNESLVVIPVVDVTYGKNVKMANYFQGEGFVPSAYENAITYTKAFNGDGQAELEFINDVLMNQFTFTVSFPNDYTNFETFDVCLTDKTDVRNVLKVSFMVEGNNKLAFWVNDFEKKIYRVSYTGEEATLNLYYQQSTNSLLINNSLTVRLNDTGLFNGFKAGFARFKVVFTGVTEQVGCAISYVCNQPFNQGSDSIKPVLYVTESTANLVEIDKEFTIKQVYAFDLLDSAATLKFKLVSSKGVFIRSVDGILLDGTQDPNRDYTVKLSEYGRYVLQYESKDCSGNRYAIENLITVQDTVAPTIEIVSGYKTQGRVGESIKVAQVNVTDNVSNKVETLCYVIDRHGRMTNVELGGEFTAQISGKYTVYYYAVDANNNVTMVSYTVNVF